MKEILKEMWSEYKEAPLSKWLSDIASMILLVFMMYCLLIFMWAMFPNAYY